MLLVVYLVLAPLGIVYITVWQRHKLQEKHYRVQFGFLLNGYAPGSEWWEIVASQHDRSQNIAFSQQ